MAGELTAIWSQHAAIKDNKLREQLAARVTRDIQEFKEQQDKDAEFAAVAIETVLAVQEQRIAALQERFDHLDTISLQALIEAQQWLEELLRDANRARDGRAVFEAQDGTIYDEDGNEVARADIDLESWDADKPGWEDFSAAYDSVARRQEIRDRVVEQGERLDDPDDEQLVDIEAELDTLEAELRAELGLDSSPGLTGQSHAESVDPFFDADISMAAAWDAAASNITDKQIDPVAPDTPVPEVPKL